MTSLETLPGFLIHLASALVLLAVATWVFVRVTPTDQFALIRDGNTAAAIGTGGVVIGFALGVAGAFRYSANLLDAAVWGVVALLVQLLVFYAMVRFLGPRWREGFERGDIAHAVFKAAVAIAVGWINAACLAT